jgi:hypothetical protein
MLSKIDKKFATVVDVTAGYSSTGLYLDIFVPTKSREDHGNLKEAIKKLIEAAGYEVYRGAK